MKKILIMIVAAGSMANYASSQDSEKNYNSKLMIGVKAGTNYSNIYDAEGEELLAKGKLGFAAGAFVSIPLGERLGIQPEVLFSQKGFKGTGRFMGESYKMTRTTSYIDVPIFFALKPISGLTILAGPQFSYLIKQKDVFESSSTSIVQQEEFQNDNIRKNSLGFVGGIDINIKHTVIGARVGCEVLNNNGNGNSTTPRYKNVWFQTTIGFRF